MPIELLQAGENVFAVHAMNHTDDSSDLLFTMIFRTRRSLDDAACEERLAEFRAVGKGDEVQNRIACFEGRALLFARRALELDPGNERAKNAVGASEFRLGIGGDAASVRQLQVPPSPRLR